jgi:transcription antitermination factor NusA-like protein
MRREKRTQKGDDKMSPIDERMMSKSRFIKGWSQDQAKYVCNALAPAKISRVYIDEENRYMEVVVADDQHELR